jgi:hypothetical protein
MFFIANSTFSTFGEIIAILLALADLSDVNIKSKT